MENVILRGKVAGQVDSRGANKRPRLAGGGESSIGSADEYEEMCQLGEGTFGTVVKARHRATGRTVAIKRLMPPEEGNEEEQPDLLHEASLHAACAGIPFVVRFHELVRDQATAELGLVMECGGANIIDFLCRNAGAFPLPELTVRALMWQLLTAASGIHARGVVHRDIKPQNILVDDDLRAAKLCDFGLAMRTSDRPPYDPAGTPGYRAPEILLQLPEYDGRVDAWSLGVVMAEVLTGKRLFSVFMDPPDEELDAIFSVLGVPDDEAWPGFLDTPLVVACIPELEDLHKPSTLRERVPETALSDRGFEVLSGLLVCNPDRRLTAADALKLPWFVDAQDTVPNTAEALSALPRDLQLVL